MSITNGYISLSELKGHLLSSGIPVEFSSEDETNMEMAIEAVSRWLDNHFGTTFYKATETRYFTAAFTDLLWIDDLIGITTIKIDTTGDGAYDTIMTTDDYWLEPRNARLNSDESQKKPYRQIRINSNGLNYFPTTLYGIEIVGNWGYCGDAGERPSIIKELVLLMSHRIFRRKDAIFGIAGTPQLGVTTVVARIKQDSDLAMLLDGIDMRGF